MLTLRWPLFITVTLLVAGTWAGRRDRRAGPEPAAAELPAAPKPPAADEPAPAPRPDQLHQGPLFPDGLPLSSLQLPEGLANPTAQGCAACHGEIQHHWEASAHATGWAEPAYGLALRAASEPGSCRSCHLPFLLQHPRLVLRETDDDPGSPEHAPNEAWSPSLQREGVTCASCHLREGKVLGPRGSGNAPHPTAQSTELASAGLCGTCHQLSWPDSELAWYDTYGEWYRSSYREAGVRCQDCHMPQRAGTATTGRFAAHASHALTIDASRAVSVLVELGGPELIRGQPFPVALRLQNTGAGHAFPTGQPGKAYVVQTLVIGSDGEPLQDPIEHRLERRVQPEPPHALIEDTRLPARGELSLQQEITLSQGEPAGPSQLRVRILDQDGAQLLFRDFPVTVR